MEKLKLTEKAEKAGYKLDGSRSIHMPEEFIGDFEIRIEVNEKYKAMKFTAHGETFDLIKGGSKSYLLTCKSGILYLSLYPKRYTSPVGQVRIDTLRTRVMIRGYATVKRITISKGVAEE